LNPQRKAWYENRLVMEKEHWQCVGHNRPSIRNRLIKMLSQCLKAAGLYDRGIRNAVDLRLNCFELSFNDLPPAFDGFSILHVSDPHFGALAGTTERMFQLVSGLCPDLVVLTGDYRSEDCKRYKYVLPPLQKLVETLPAPHGIWAILGNNDCADMVEPMEEIGIKMLINETDSIEQEGENIYITGVDDVHAFHTHAAPKALENAPQGFRIALVHSAELADTAAACGYDLYLTGHTHGGQIALPGGVPVISNLKRFRRYASGLWHRGDMVGYTSSCVGISVVPLRFYTRGEVALIKLRCSASMHK